MMKGVSFDSTAKLWSNNVQELLKWVFANDETTRKEIALEKRELR
jgi:hypothetical protein